jgi:hypothetical protein
MTFHLTSLGKRLAYFLAELFRIVLPQFSQFFGPFRMRFCELIEELLDSLVAKSGPSLRFRLLLRPDVFISFDRPY